MARYSKNLKLYLPEINDPNSIYVKGFVENFNVIDEKLNDIFSTTIAKSDLAFNEITEENRNTKRALTDVMSSLWQSHIKKRKQVYSEQTALNVKADNNPHDTGIADMWIPDGYTNIAQTMINQINKDINKTSNNNKIDWTIVNTKQGSLDSIGTTKEDRLHSDLKIEFVNLPGYDNNEENNRKHISDAQANKWESHVNIIDKTINPHRVSAQSLTSSSGDNTGGNAIIDSLNSNDTSSSINWSKINKSGSNINDITNRNHDDLQNIGNLNYELKDIDKNKHLSNKDGNDIFGHIFSKSENELNIKDLDNKGIENSIYPTAKINPHQVRAMDLWSENTESLKHGSQTIINEINNNGLSNKIIKGDKLIWNIVDLNNADGEGKKASIVDFPLRSHQLLQEILGTSITSSDTVKNKHISNKDHKDIVDHIANISNPHNVTAFQITGTEIVSEINTDRTSTKINKNKINFTDINITDIPNRNHNDLKNIEGVNTADTDTLSVKHISNAQSKKWEDHVNTIEKATSNPHGVSAQNLKSSNDDSIGGQAIQKAINEQGIANGINWTKINKDGSNLTNITTRNHDDLQNKGLLDLTKSDELQNKHLSNKQGRKWEDHTDTTDGTNPHKTKASNLYDKNGQKTGGDAIIESINENSASNLINWDKLSKNTANIDSIPKRSHQSLQDILPSSSTSNTDKNKHISNDDFINWENHRNNRNNPHGVSASQIGGTSIVNELNSTSTSKIIKDKIDFTGYNLTDIEIRNHDSLQNIAEINKEDSDIIKNKHISNADAKKWEDHVNTINSNPHKTRAKDISVDPIDGVDNSNIQKALADLSLKTTYNSGGLISDSSNSIIKSGDSIIVRSNDFVLYHSRNMSGKLFNHTIPQKTFEISSIEKNKIGYVYAEYNTVDSSVSYSMVYDINLINFSNQFPLCIFYITNSSHSIVPLSDYGNGTVEKISKKDLLLNKVEIENGLYLEHDSDSASGGTELLNGDIKTTSGIIWKGLERYELIELTLRENKNPITWYKTNISGNWETENITSLKRGLIDTGSGVEGITGSDLFTSNWIYRDIYEDKWYMILSGMSYSKEETVDMKIGYADAQPPVKLPNEISEKSILVGKVITSKNEPIKNIAIYRTQGIIFTNTSTGYAQLKTHNSLEKIQGGKIDEYYHLSLGQLNKLNSVELNADVTNNTNVGSCITDIIKDSTGESGITIVDIYNNAKTGSDNKLDKSGGTMTGTIYSDAKYLIKSNLSNCSIYSDNLLFGMTRSDNAWVFRYDKTDGVVNFSKTPLVNNNKMYHYGADVDINMSLFVDKISKFKFGSDKWKDSEILNNISIELGNSNTIGGSIKLWGTVQDRYALIRSQHSDLFYDTSGVHYFNWDKTDFKGKLFLGNGDGINNAEENQVKLFSNDKSYFANGIRIGTSINSSGYIADFGGDINMNINSIRGIKDFEFMNSASLISSMGTPHSIILKTNSPTMSRLSFQRRDEFIEAASVGVNGKIIGLFQGSSLANIIARNVDDGNTSIYWSSIPRFTVDSEGIDVTGDIKERGVRISEKYLSLDGGEMNGAITIINEDDAQLILGKTYDSSINIKFIQRGLNLTNYLGVADGVLKFGDASTNGDLYSSGYRVYHEGFKPTVDDIDAVKKTGDEMTGTLWTKNIKSQLRGFRPSSNDEHDLNNRLSLLEMEWSYTGIKDLNNAVNKFPMSNNANGVLTFNTHGGNYGHQVGLSSNGNLYHRMFEESRVSSWSKIYTENSKPTADELGVVSLTGSTMSGNLEAQDIIGRKYLKLKDYYNKDLVAEMWINKDNNSWYTNSMYIDNIENLLVGRNKVYHTGNKPTIAEIGAISNNGGNISGDLSIINHSCGFVVTNAESGHTKLESNAITGINVYLGGVATTWYDDIAKQGFYRGNTTNIANWAVSINGTDIYSVDFYENKVKSIYDNYIIKSAPITFYKDSRDSSSGYVGFGSSDGVFQIGNQTTGKAISLYPNGDLTYGDNYIYHSGNKPNKSDVGLSNVYNYGITNDVNSNSSEMYTTMNLLYNTRALMVYTGKDFIVGGDANTYYPVQINLSGKAFKFWDFSISRGFDWDAPDTWNNSTHKGGLTLSMQWSGDGAWGGNDHSLRVIQFSEQYSNIVARLDLLKVGVVVWLRGGGARYRLNSETGINANVIVHEGDLTDSDGAIYSTLTNRDLLYTVQNKFPVRGNGRLFVENQEVYHPGNKPTNKDLNSLPYNNMFSSSVPKTFYGVTQVQSTSPDYVSVGGGSQNFMLQMATDHDNEGNSYVGQIAWGYSANDPKIAIRCKTPSSDGKWQYLLKYDEVMGATACISGHLFTNTQYPDMSYVHSFPPGFDGSGRGYAIRTGNSSIMNQFTFKTNGDFETPSGGSVVINKSGESIILKPYNGTAMYIAGKNSDNTDSFFVGKGSSDSDDITLYSYTHSCGVKIKSDRVVADKNLYVSTNQVYHQGFKPMVGKRTTLWSGNLDIGAFTLSESFENYDYLIFETSAQDGASFGYHTVFKEELLQIKNSSNPIAINGGNWMWACRISSDGRTFTSTYEICRMRKVIGGKI